MLLQFYQVKKGDDQVSSTYVLHPAAFAIKLTLTLTLTFTFTLSLTLNPILDLTWNLTLTHTGSKNMFR